MTGRAGRLLRQLRIQAPAIVTFLAVIVAWELGVPQLHLQNFILPVPSAIAAAFTSEWEVLQKAAAATLYEALGGLVIGVIAGVLTAFAVSRWARVREAILPIAIGASAIPIIAAAPIMSNWFGILNPFSKMAVVILLVFFPMLVNVSRGLSQVDESAVELMRASAASQGQILRKVRIPNALPYFFTALKICTTLSLIGAVVAEYFGGSNDVLGRVIVQSSSRLRFDITWAAIAVAAGAGIALYLLALVAERLVIPWHASQRSAES
ncbi:MAG TPA: ABC transporter permease subunit [Candidatus Limnocylindria bacterium]|nr:ABC transporter permease subunit [Candidatus Limnocylindria bacterium]